MIKAWTAGRTFHSVSVSFWWLTIGIKYMRENKHYVHIQD